MTQFNLELRYRQGSLSPMARQINPNLQIGFSNPCDPPGWEATPPADTM